MICSHLNLHGSIIQVETWVRSWKNTCRCQWSKSDSNRVEQKLSRVVFASLGCSKCISFQRTPLIHVTCLVASYMSHLFRWNMMVQDARVVFSLCVCMYVYVSQLWSVPFARVWAFGDRFIQVNLANCSTINGLWLTNRLDGWLWNGIRLTNRQDRRQPQRNFCEPCSMLSECVSLWFNECEVVCEWVWVCSPSFCPRDVEWSGCLMNRGSDFHAKVIRCEFFQKVMV